MIKKGRQIGKTLDKIRDDHLNRYKMAVEMAKQRNVKIIWDVGCGVGYGAFLAASEGFKVFAADYDKSALEYGGTYYSHENLYRAQVRIEDDFKVPVGFEKPGLIVAFEIIEHIKNAPEVLQKLARQSQYLVASVPNENLVPFKFAKHREHVRHYTPKQFKQTLETNGWKVSDLGCQIGKRKIEAKINFTHTAGRTLIAIGESKCLQ